MMNDEKSSFGGDAGDAVANDDDDAVAHDDDDDADVDPDVRLGAMARRVGSDQSMALLKRVAMGLALAFLVGAIGYFVGVRTTEPRSNAVDVGFLRDMGAHHDQAVQMSLLELANGTDSVARGFALEVIMFQRQELGRIQNFQDTHGVRPSEYNPDRTSMEWMGMPTPLKNMTGMATDDQLAQLSAAKGIEADKLFLTLMQNHHLGGAHMADYEAQNGADPLIREMAAGMAKTQRVEVKEYQTVIDRLNNTK